MYPVGTIIRTKDGNYWEITDLYNHDGDRYFKVTERPRSKKKGSARGMAKRLRSKMSMHTTSLSASSTKHYTACPECEKKLSEALRG